MHVAISDPETGQSLGTICIDRSTQTCYILQADIEQLDTLVAIARAQKVPQVILVTPIQGVEELQSLGWVIARDKVVMMKGSKNGS